jgi:hypothetical protein
MGVIEGTQDVAKLISTDELVVFFFFLRSTFQNRAAIVVAFVIDFPKIVRTTQNDIVLTIKWSDALEVYRSLLFSRTTKYGTDLVLENHVRYPRDSEELEIPSCFTSGSRRITHPHTFHLASSLDHQCNFQYHCRHLAPSSTKGINTHCRRSTVSSSFLVIKCLLVSWFLLILSRFPSCNSCCIK